MALVIVPNLDSSPLKFCRKGNHFLPISSFTKDRNRPDGLHPQCKDCRKCFREENKTKIHQSKARYLTENREQINHRGREFYHRNKDKNRLRRKLYRKKAKAHIQQKAKERYIAEREVIKKRSHDRYHADPAKILAKQKDYNQRNPDRYKVFARYRRSRRKAAPGSYTVQQWREKLELWGYKCYYCRTPLTGQTIHQEHRIPLTRGGSNWIANIVPACAKCNLTKHTRTESEFRQLMQVI